MKFSNYRQHLFFSGPSDIKEACYASMYSGPTCKCQHSGSYYKTTYFLTWPLFILHNVGILRGVNSKQPSYCLLSILPHFYETRIIHNFAIWHLYWCPTPRLKSRWQPESSKHYEKAIAITMLDLDTLKPQDPIYAQIIFSLGGNSASNRRTDAGSPSCSCRTRRRRWCTTDPRRYVRGCRFFSVKHAAQVQLQCIWPTALTPVYLCAYCAQIRLPPIRQPTNRTTVTILSTYQFSYTMDGSAPSLRSSPSVSPLDSPDRGSSRRGTYMLVGLDSQPEAAWLEESGFPVSTSR